MKNPIPCPECEEGTLRTSVEDYEVVTSDGNRIVVPQVELSRCDHCGVTLVPAASSRLISEFQAQATEQLTRKELHDFFVRSNLTQKDFAEAFGLGEKTFHRWLKGTQVVSRSMGYYLRAMDRFPEVFEWVHNRGWREVAKLKKTHPSAKPVFEALSRHMQIQEVTFIRYNPARRLTEGAIHCRG